MSHKFKQIAEIYMTDNQLSIVNKQLSQLTSQQMYAKCKQTVDKLVKNN